MGVKMYKRSDLERVDVSFLLRVFTLVSLGVSVVIIILGLVHDVSEVFYHRGLAGAVVGVVGWLALGPLLFGGNLYTLKATHAFKRWDVLPQNTQAIAILTIVTGAVAISLFFCSLLCYLGLWSAMSSEGY
jgi:hypothetical protein